MRLVLGLLVSITSLAGEIRALASLGYTTDTEVVKTITLKARKYGIRPELMIAIAVLESGLNPMARRINANGTIDYGMFQINTVNRDFCKGLRIDTVKGNTECAAKLLAYHKVKKPIDSIWYCRYHSKTPSKKLEYCNKLHKIRSQYEWEMKTLSLAKAN